MMRLLFKLIPLAVLGFIGYQGFQQIGSLVDAAGDFGKINATQNEMAGILQAIAVEHQTGNGFPYDFRDFVRQHFQKPTGSYKEVWQDGWMNDYQCEYGNAGCLIRSMGPDSVAGTADDLVSRYGRF